MNRYLLTIPIEMDYNAASKARVDIEVIAMQLGYQLIPLKGERTANGSPGAAFTLLRLTLLNWQRIAQMVDDDSILLIQYPYYPMKAALLLRWMIPWLKRTKHLHFIALVHDLNSLRGTFGKAASFSDTVLLPRFDAVICHNSLMKQYLITRGTSAGRLVTLGLFDYLTDASIVSHALSDGVAIAGNLSKDKCGYVQELIHNLKGQLQLHLYGKGLEDVALPRNAVWHGSFLPDELPACLQGAFGLVWDGPSMESCEGAMGNYLRYNNPHKVSLYLASGMPVLIWKEAALAKWIVDNRLGVTISCLEELPEIVSNITEQEYEKMRQNIVALQNQLRTGRFFSHAIKIAESKSEVTPKS